MANVNIVSQTTGETSISLPAGRTFIRFKNVDPTNNHTVELIPLDSNSQIVKRSGDTDDWTKTDDGFGVSLLRNIANGNTAKNLLLDYQVTVNTANNTPITVIDKRRNIQVGAVDLSTYKGDVSGQMTEIANQLSTILTNAGFINTVTVNNKQGVSINITNTKTIDKVLEIYSNVTDNTGTVVNLTAVDNGVVNFIERKPTNNAYGNHAITFAISATPRVPPVVSTANATDSTTGIVINDSDVFDIYIDNLDVPKYANLTKAALLQMFSPSSDEDIEIIEQARTITCVGALPYSQGLSVKTGSDGILNLTSILNGATTSVQMRENYITRMNAIQNLYQTPTTVFKILPDTTDRALVGLSVSGNGGDVYNQAPVPGVVITSIDNVTLQKPIVINTDPTKITNALNIGTYKTLLAQLNINVKNLYINNVAAIGIYNLDPTISRTISGYLLPGYNGTLYLDPANKFTPLQCNLSNLFYNNDFRLNNSTTSTSYNSNNSQLSFTTVLQPAMGPSDFSGNISKNSLINGSKSTNAQYFVELTVTGTEKISRDLIADQIGLGNAVGLNTPTVIVGSDISDLVSNLNTYFKNLSNAIFNSKNNTMQYALAYPTFSGGEDYNAYYTRRDVYDLDGNIVYKYGSDSSAATGNGVDYEPGLDANYLTITGDGEVVENATQVNVNIPGICIKFNNVDKSRTINNGKYYNYFYADQNDYPNSGNYTDALNYPIKRAGVYITCNVMNQGGLNTGYQGNLVSPSQASVGMSVYYVVSTTNSNTA